MYTGQTKADCISAGDHPLTETESPRVEGENYQKRTWYLGYVASNISGGLTTPLIPLFVTIYLGLSVLYVGLTTAIVSAASVPALIFWGILSDRYKKRKIFILIGFVGAFATLLPIVLVKDLGAYLFVLIAFQLLVMASVPVSTLILIENARKEQWSGVMGKFNTLASVGTVIGLALGIVLVVAFSSAGSSILLTMYVVSAVFYLIAAVVIQVTVPEPKRTIPRRFLGRIHSVRVQERQRFLPTNVVHFLGLGGSKHPLTRDLKAYLFSTFLLMFAFQVFMVPYPVFMINNLGATQREIYILYLANAVLGTVTFTFTGRLSGILGLRGILGMSLIIRIAVFGVVGLLATVSSPSSTWILVYVVIFGLIGSLWSFIGISETASISGISPPELRGKAIGYYNSLNGVGQIFGGTVSGVLSSLAGYSTDFLVAAIILVVGAATILRMTPSNRAEKKARDYVPQL